MRIDHVAIWARDIEILKDFYVRYFHADCGEKYTNPAKSFQSYFLTFSGDSRLEIMQKPDIPPNRNNTEDQYQGIIHLALSVGSREKVLELTAELAKDGYSVVSAPRETGDGYFESCILDPESNRIEITD